MRKNYKLIFKKSNINKSCRDYQLMNKLFLEDKLSDREEREYAHHMLSCESCLNDLKEYFMFSTAFHYMDNLDDTRPSDVTKLLNRVIQRERERRKQVWYIIFIVLSAATAIFVLMTFFI